MGNDLSLCISLAMCVCLSLYDYMPLTVRVPLTYVFLCKGGQWPAVVVWDDFADVDCLDSLGNPKLPYEDELNLVYVAVTRAQHTLFVNASIEQAWERECRGSRLVLRNVPLEQMDKYLVCSSCGIEAKLEAAGWLELAQVRASLRPITNGANSIICDGCAQDKESEMYTLAQAVHAMMK